MKAAVLKEFGGVENLSLDDLPIPRVDHGSVLLRAAAASANPVDVSVRKGSPFSPFLPAAIGCDVAGVVEAVGEGVTEFAPGDEVFGCVGGVRVSGGTLAQYVLADAKLLALKPRTLFMREAAALPLVAITAHEGMTRGGVLPTHLVLIHGGTGGVGHVAVQLAAALRREGIRHGLCGITRACDAIGVAAGRRDEVLPLLRAHGDGCVRNEPGTLQFQVLVPREDRTKLFAIEVYRDDDAFEAHRNAASIARFREEAAGMFGTIQAMRCTVAD